MLRKIVTAVLFLSISSIYGQGAGSAASSPTRPAQAPLQISDPHYQDVSESIDVNAPAEKVWARVGSFCDISKWYPTTDGATCTYLAGSGDVGTVRSVAHEVLVGKTAYSYTYAQAPRENALYNLYHGTLEVISLTPKTSRLHYVLFFDTSMLDGAVRETYVQRHDAMLKIQLKNMKVIAEEGSTRGGAIAVSAPSDDAQSSSAPFLSKDPRYVVIPMQIDVDATADKVWSTIGHFCDIAKLGKVGYPTCQITSGIDGEYGVVRNIGREVLVGKTQYSYTYAQQLRANGFYLLYHGTVEARAISVDKATLYWTLVYDNSNLPDDAARERDIESRRARFNEMLKNVKVLAEGGSIPAGS